MRPCTCPASPMCSRSPAITRQSWPGSSSLCCVRCLRSCWPSAAVIPSKNGRRSPRLAQRHSTSCCGGGGRDPALVHHDQYRARRGHDRSPDAHVSHAEGRGLRRAPACTRSRRPSELPDVVCSDTRARRRLPAGSTLDEPRRRHAARRQGRALGRPRDRRPGHLSLLAGTATVPYIAYHFHRISPYGGVANLLAMPIVSAWVMPVGILGLMSMPLGLDGWCWRLMGEGIEWMMRVARWVTSFPGALGRVAAFGPGPLLLCTSGLIVLCLLRTPLRFIGALMMGGAIILMIRAPQPDVLIAADGSAVALRGANGRLSMIKSGNDVFAFREWLAADADARTPK